MTIRKSKDKTVVSSRRQAAGVRQEQDVAFYLRRAFKDTDDYIVINDYAFEYNGERAQIDHLIVHRFGFLIIESKSIYGEVKVNDTGEWSRSYKGQWSGIPSPIKQAELQLDVLQSMLRENVTAYLGKILGLQQGVGGRKWDAVCAVSNNCILHRDRMPKEISERIIKSEGVEEAVRSYGDYSLLKKLFTSAPAFSAEEMISIADYLMAYLKEKDTDIPDTPESVEAAPHAVHEPSASYQVTQPDPVQVVSEQAAPPLLSCKKCGESEQLEGKYGKYGYYVQCGACGTNTSMRKSCARCGKKAVKVTKRRNEYWAVCECSEPYLLFVQRTEDCTA